MAFIQDGRAVAGNAAVENANKAQRAAIVPRSSRNFCLSATTGTIGAAAAAGAAVFAMRLSPTSHVNVFIERIRLQYTTIVAYTTPVTAGRRLGIYRGNTANPTGGTAFTAVGKKELAGIDSQCEAAQGGAIAVATTAALTAGTVAYEANLFAEQTLTHVGAAGAYDEHVFEFNAGESAPLQLAPGQLVAIRCVNAMDAAGTWQLGIRVDWHEALTYSSTTADT